MEDKSEKEIGEVKTNQLFDRGMDYDEIYTRLFPAIYRFAYRILGDAEEAKDVAQATFTQFFTGCSNGDPPRHIQGWLYRVAANACRDLLRHNIRKQRVYEEIGRSIVTADSAEQEILRKSEIERLKKAMSTLSIRQRIMLMLHQDGLRYEAIGRAAGVRKYSVSKLLTRAMQRLMKAMDQGE